MIKAIIFDFGGVILTYESRMVWDIYAAEKGLDKETVAKLMYAYLSGAHEGKYASITEYFEKVKPNIGVTLDNANDLVTAMNATMYIDPRMVEFLESLKRKYKIALLSNFTSDLAEFLERFHLRQFFDLVVCSYDMKMKKPDPRIYEYTLGQLGVEPQEAIFIDDNPIYVRGAQMIGMRAITFETFEQCKEELNSTP